MKKFFYKPLTKVFFSFLFIIIVLLGIWSLQYTFMMKNFENFPEITKSLSQDASAIFQAVLDDKGKLKANYNEILKNIQKDLPVGKINVRFSLKGIGGNAWEGEDHKKKYFSNLEPGPILVSYAESSEYYELQLQIPEEIKKGDAYYDAYQVYQYIRQNSEFYSGLLISCLIAGTALLIYLGSTVGRDHHNNPLPLLNIDHIPLEILFAITVALILSLSIIGFASLSMGKVVGLRHFAFEVIYPIASSLAIALVSLGSIVRRLRHRVLLKNSYMGRFGGRLLKLLKELLSWMKSRVLILAKHFARVPILWKYLILVVVYLFVNYHLALHAFQYSSSMAFLLAVIFNGMVIVLIGWLLIQLKDLSEQAEKMAEGALDLHPLKKPLLPELARHSERLQSMSLVMNKAIEERMTSERFKTELITNVSHDLKTPLTSIINYVELLQREKENPELVDEYLQVLDRQSLRLKKLVENLLEVSKASTGNLVVNREKTQVQELIHQLEGEYRERFQESDLQFLCSYPETPLYIMSDARHLGRVFDNLLENVLKYALEGTRVYLDVKDRKNQVEISIKNISRDILNISADELKERFVRGDSSRSSEGSGLGLAIAENLTEIQDGKLSLFTEGDLFKVILLFPKEESWKS